MYGESVKNVQGIYNQEEQRIGCMYCAFGVTEETEPNRFQRMQETHPKHYDLCMRTLESGGLGMKNVLQYMHVPYETWEPVGQMKSDFSESNAGNVA